MRATGSLAVLVLCALAAAPGRAQPPEAPLPPAERTPRLVVRHPGPHAPVAALAFGPDGTLYAGGFGKVVHRYAPAGGKYAPAEPLRVPVGPTNAGVVNAVAVSPDGKWVAVAGRAPLRGESWTGGDDGVVVETRHFPPLLKRDYGVVYLFNPADPRGGKVVRGPEAGVRALAFAAPAPASGPVLVTAGIEWDADGKEAGTLRAFDVNTGKELKARGKLPDTPTRPGLAAWAGADGALRVAVAWPDSDAKVPGELVVWDATAGTEQRFKDGARGVALALRPAPLELVSGAVVGGKFGLVRRPADPPAAGAATALTGTDKEFYFPLAVAAVGADTAVLAQVIPPPPGTVGRATELRVVAPDGTTRGKVKLEGVSALSGTIPSLAASADGKLVAVAGFTDDRIEVHAVAAVAASQTAADVLPGAPPGFSRVGFLPGPKLWLGAADAGVVFDPVARTATPAGKVEFDAHGGGRLAFANDPKANAVTVTVGGQARTFALRKNELATAAALLPAAPAWDPALKSVVAVARYNEFAAVSLVSLYDATDGRRLLELGGPALRVDDLAFSGSRPLLAAVGPDRTVSVWSLKNLTAPFAAVEGVAMVERDGKLAVASVAAGSPAAAALKAGDAVDAVGGETGDLRDVKTYRDFLLAVRAVPVGGTARVRVNGAVAAVPVGRGVGHRHPLFELWVDPAANPADGRDWIGWTPAGPYDANAAAAEARLGWLTATGNPAAPAVYAGADQYRRDYYKPNFFRFLADTADFEEARKLHAEAFPRTRPALAIVLETDGERDGVRLLRTKPAGLAVRLDDPDEVLDRETLTLRWRAGAGGEWKALPLADGEATLPLAGYDWARGAHRFELEVREAPDKPPAATAAATYRYAPPAPTVAVKVNGAAVAPGGAVTSATPEVELTADVTSAPGEAVEVTVTTTGPGGAAPVRLPAGKDGKYGPVALKLDPDAKTAVRVTARHAAGGADEAAASDLVVYHTPAPPRVVPRVALALASPVDPPSAAGRPFVTDAPTVRLAATIAAEGMTAVEWDDGDGKWAPGAVPKGDAPATREVKLAEGGVPRTLRVRVTAGGGATRTDAVSVVWAGLPTADFGPVPVTVRESAFRAVGPVTPQPNGGAYEVQVVVAPAAAGAEPRPFAVRGGEPGTWTSAVELAPGDNVLTLVARNEWKQVRLAARNIRYVRPPVVAAVAPVQARGDDVVDVLAAVVSPADLPPDRLTLDGRPLGARVVGAPVGAFGLAVWWLKADDVPLGSAGVLPKDIRVAARNSDGDGDALTVPVLPRAVAPPPAVPAPVVVLTVGRDGPAIGPGETIVTDMADFTLGIRVAAAQRLTDVTLRRENPATRDLDPVPGVSAGNGLALDAVPVVRLHRGVNVFEVTAAAGGRPAVVRATVSYNPPPVRVEIDEIAEVLPGGAFRQLERPASGPVTTGVAHLRVKGKVVFADPAEAARASGYDVVLFANDVRHLPVEVRPPAGGKAEVPFEARLFLNAPATTVKIDVARRRQADPLPKQVADARLTVEATGPLTRQRLHVVVVAPEEPEGRVGAIAREVVVALNGTFAGRADGFTDGPFNHKAFAEAVLYRPLVHAVNRADVVGRLHVVEGRIRELAAAGGAAGYVNDVVILYYQGRDLMGEDGVRRIHTTRSLGAVGNKALAAAHAIRLDELPPTSGVRFAVLNVATDDGKEPLQRVTAGPLLLRYAWRSRESFPELLEFYRRSIAANPTVGTVVDWVRKVIEEQAATQRLGAPTETLTPTVRERPFGPSDGRRP